jgi:hypothetical protein
MYASTLRNLPPCLSLTGNKNLYECCVIVVNRVMFVIRSKKSFCVIFLWDINLFLILRM